MRAAAGLILWQVAVAAVPSSPYYYEATTTETGGEKAEPRVTRMRAWVEGPRARVEFVEGTRRDLPKGSYIVTKDGGETVYFVNPKNEAYARWELDDVIRDVAERLKKEGGLVKLELSDVIDEKLLEEPSDKILGFPATHRRWRSGYKMKYSLLGIEQVRREDVVHDVWFSDRIAGPGFDSLLQPRRLETGHAGLDKVLAGKLGEPRGFTLRSETVTKMRKGNGEEQTRRSRTEVTVLRQEPADPSLFEIPAGYEERPFKRVR